MTDLEGRSAPDAYGTPEVECTPEWEPDAVQQIGLLRNWWCACGATSLGSFVGEENARADFVRHVLNRPPVKVYGPMRVRPGNVLRVGRTEFPWDKK